MEYSNWLNTASQAKSDQTIKPGMDPETMVCFDVSSCQKMSVNLWLLALCVPSKGIQLGWPPPTDCPFPKAPGPTYLLILLQVYPAQMTIQYSLTSSPQSIISSCFIILLKFLLAKETAIVTADIFDYTFAAYYYLLCF